MEFHFLHNLTFLSVAVVVSHAALTSQEAYWKSVLPNTPMPKTIGDLLHPAGKGILGAQMNIGSKHFGLGNAKSGRYSDNGDGIHRKWCYLCAATDDEVNNNPSATLFFLKPNMQKGTNMNLHFTKSTSLATFLPRQVAESIPFSSNKLHEIFNQLSVKPNTIEAKIIEKTIKECTTIGIEGEENYCATSLESMIDFTTSKLGNKVQAISTEIITKQSTHDHQLQKYTIVGVKKFVMDKSVICHKQNYAYVVFYCHKIVNTKAYMVSLVGVDRTKAKAIAICHMNTQAWSPKHLAFLVLKVKRGTTPICHFLSEDIVAWVPY